MACCIGAAHTAVHRWEYGKCEHRGLRCCYHGWLFGADGELLEAPGEPPDTPLLRNVRQGAYPVEIDAGIVFAYLGPSAHRPAFPVYDTFGVPGTRRAPYVCDYPCNWLQVVENAMDPVHAVFLHTRNHGPSFSQAWGQLGIKEYHAVDEGFHYTNARRVDDNILGARASRDTAEHDPGRRGPVHGRQEHQVLRTPLPSHAGWSPSTTRTRARSRGRTSAIDRIRSARSG